MTSLSFTREKGKESSPHRQEKRFVSSPIVIECVIAGVHDARIHSSVLCGV
jgi:hypothetical protein